QQQFGQSVSISALPLADADPVSGGAGGTPGEQQGGAGVEAGDSPAEKQSLLQNGLQRLYRQHAHEPDRHLSPGRGECARVPGRVAGAPCGGLWRSGCLAAVELPGARGFALGQLLPIVCHPRLLRIAIPQHDGQLACGQVGTHVLGGGPPGEAALREALRAQPVALPVVTQNFERGACAVPEDIERTAEGIVAEGSATDSGESINPFAEVDRLRGHKDTTLRGQLEHAGVSKKVRTNATSGGCGSWEGIRSRAPSGRESLM